MKLEEIFNPLKRSPSAVGDVEQLYYKVKPRLSDDEIAQIEYMFNTYDDMDPNSNEAFSVLQDIHDKLTHL